MSKNKKSESAIPAGFFTPTHGWNYGLDGFHFHDTYGDGVLEGASLPSVQGLSSLPDTVIGVGGSQIPDVDIDLSTTIDLRDTDLTKQGSLVNLDWLKYYEPDPDRVPKSPKDRALQELHEAWGVDRRTDGIHLIPNVDKAVLRSEEDLVKDREDKSKKASFEAIHSAALRAQRSSTLGEPLEKIAKDLLDTLGGDLEYLRKFASALKEEHGLIGNVYIRASSFPNCQNGKWASEVRQKTSHAKFILRKSKCTDCVFAQNNHCTVFNKTLVSQIPWEEAFASHSPKLEKSGRSVSAFEAPHIALRNAYLQTPEKKVETSYKPLHITPSERISLEEAKDVLASSSNERVVISQIDRDRQKLRAKVETQIKKWASNGYISEDKVLKLLSSKASSKLILKAAMSVVSSFVKSSSYEGSGLAFIQAQGLSEEEAWRELRASELQIAQEQVAIKTAEAKKSLRFFNDMVKAGLITIEEQRTLVKYADTKGHKKAVSLTEALISKRSSERSKISSVVKTSSYEGEGLGMKESSHYLEPSRKPKFSSNEISKVTSWLKTQMNESIAGNDLNFMLKSRFHPDLLKEASAEIIKLREEYEGLAGHFYVDSQVYASKTGTTGCDKGGLIHRANNIKLLLSMDRCKSCVFKNADNFCQKYNKLLIDEIPAQVKDQQQEVLRLKDVSDSEKTASLFAPRDTSIQDFDLRDPLESFSINEAPKLETLGEILFDGWEV